MKLIVIGLGQCGGRIADEFSRMNGLARSQRGIEIAPSVFAVNTDIADLSSLSNIKSDYRHRILIGNRKTVGHGVGKINQVGAELAKQDADKIIEAARSSNRFYEADAFLLIAGAAGGTGSGLIAVIAEEIQERYQDKPVYCMLALPFEHEETIEARTKINTATCLKATYSIADAVFLVDNQRYLKKDASVANNMLAINRLIAAPFYELLCAGEEKKAKNIGARLLDAGDIGQTLGGWSIIGYGKSDLPIIRLPFGRNMNFRKKGVETHKGLMAMDQAISNLSLECDSRDATSALYLLSAPSIEMNMDLVKELGEYLREMCPDAVIRYGDYPRGESALRVTVILSNLTRVEKVLGYYDAMNKLVHMEKQKQKANEAKIKELIDASEEVPSLLG